MLVVCNIITGTRRGAGGSDEASINSYTFNQFHGTFLEVGYPDTGSSA